MYKDGLKRGIDFLLSLVGIIVLSPILLILCIAIKIDSKGPVIFKQKRVGKNKSHFYIYKFRTMKVDTPQETPTHLLSNPDFFITRVGKFLRKTSLDELPQLFNILKGDMAVIGPRQALWNQYDLIEEVKLLGRFKNPYVWLNNADFFIHSSKYEGFGLVLIEAAILDKLVISSNCPVGPTEILENGKSGILFNVGESEELAEKIEKVLNDKNLRNRYILSMKKRREDFKKENVLKEYEKLIDEI